MIKKIVFYLLIFAVGLVIGWYVFSGTQKREPLFFYDCNPKCLNNKEVLGLMASLGLRLASGYIPDKIFETEKTIAVLHPNSKSKHHYVIIPKKDIKNIGEISEADKIYLLDAMTVIQKIISDKHLITYQVVTNGPGYQDVSYLHFHLVSE